MSKIKKQEVEFLRGIQGKYMDEMPEKERKTLDAIYDGYGERFEKLLKDKMIDYEKDECFRQCSIPYYVPYWFISNKGNVWSLSGAKPRKLKPFAKGNSDGRLERFKLRTPYGNVFLHQLVANHFCGDDFIKFAPNEPIEIHHVEPTAEDRDSADKLRKLPRSIHKMATYAQNHWRVGDAIKAAQREIEDAIAKGIPIIDISGWNWTGDGILYLPDGEGGCDVQVVRATFGAKTNIQAEESKE